MSIIVSPKMDDRPKCIGDKDDKGTIECRDNTKNKCYFCTCTNCILGEGGFGVVYKGNLEQVKGEKSEVAVKRIITKRGVSVPDLKKEAAMMLKVAEDGHKNILTFHFYVPNADMM